MGHHFRLWSCDVPIQVWEDLNPLPALARSDFKMFVHITAHTPDDDTIRAVLSNVPASTSHSYVWIVRTVLATTDSSSGDEEHAACARNAKRHGSTA